jgi:hypothetical protein
MRKPQTMICYAYNGEGYDHTPMVRAIARMREMPQYSRMRFGQSSGTWSERSRSASVLSPSRTPVPT